MSSVTIIFSKALHHFLLFYMEQNYILISVLVWNDLQATKGTFASKHGITKVSKQVALAFCKRTLIRCRKFEDSGISCFSEPALREIVYAPPPQFSEMELLSGVNPAAANGKHFILLNVVTNSQYKI